MINTWLCRGSIQINYIKPQKNTHSSFCHDHRLNCHAVSSEHSSFNKILQKLYMQQKLLENTRIEKTLHACSTYSIQFCGYCNIPPSIIVMKVVNLIVHKTMCTYCDMYELFKTLLVTVCMLYL